jgi:hypothetical protein
MNKKGADNDLSCHGIFNVSAYCLLVYYGLFRHKPLRQYRQHILAPGVQNQTPRDRCLCQANFHASPNNPYK